MAVRVGEDVGGATRILAGCAKIVWNFCAKITSILFPLDNQRVLD